LLVLPPSLASIQQLHNTTSQRGQLPLSGFIATSSTLQIAYPSWHWLQKNFQFQILIRLLHVATSKSRLDKLVIETLRQGCISC